MITDTEKENALADCFYNTHQLTNAATYNNIQSRVLNSINLINVAVIDEYKLIKPCETKVIIKQLKTSKAPGIDNIQNALIKKSFCQMCHTAVIHFYACFILSRCMESCECYRNCQTQQRLTIEATKDLFHCSVL